MAKNIAINGFGRIGRQMLKIALDDPTLNVVAINDLTDAPTLAHLFKYDSVHGVFKGDIKAEGNQLIINNKTIQIIAEKDPLNLPWKALNVDIVVEATGAFTKKSDIEKHIQAGAKKVLLTAPPKDDVKMLVIGVNEKDYSKETDHIISNASCTTNCLAPVVKALNDAIGIEKGYMTTIHAYTNDQRILDLPHKDLRRARAAAINMIPTTTGAAKAVGKVIPELSGKLDGYSVRVPIPCGSLTDFACIVKRDTTKEEINAILKAAANGPMNGVLEYSQEPLVSQDIVGNPSSSIVDSLSTMANGRLVKVVAWYDNEWGYSNRLVDLLRMM